MMERRSFLGFITAGLGWAVVPPALAQSVSDTSWHFDVDSEADVVAATEIGTTQAAAVIGTRDKLRPAFYTSLDLVYFNTSVIQKVEIHKVFGEFRAPLRHMTVGPDGTVWTILPPPLDSDTRKPRLVGLDREGKQTVQDLDYEWSPQSLITAIGVMGPRWNVCGFRSASDAALIGITLNGVSRRRSYPKPDGFYAFFPLDERNALAVSGELSDTRSPSVVSTLRIFDPGLTEQASGTVPGWIRAVEFVGGAKPRLIVMAVPSAENERSFRVEEFEITESRLRSVSSSTGEGSFVAGSLALVAGRAQPTVAAVRSSDSSLVVGVAKEFASAKPVAKLNAGEDLIVGVRWLRSGDRVSLLEERLTRVGNAVRKRVSVVPSTETARMLGSG